jgi:DNA-directed RNA polymerase subunit RPC12/RpoP
MGAGRLLSSPRPISAGNPLVFQVRRFGPVDCLRIGSVRGHNGRMATGQITDVIFACSKCGMIYSAVQERKLVDEAKTFNCTHCSTQILEWLGEFDYHGWKQITMRPQRPGEKLQ